MMRRDFRDRGHTGVYDAERSVFLPTRWRGCEPSLRDAAALIHRWCPGIEVTRAGRGDRGRYLYPWKDRPARITLGSHATLPSVCHEAAHAMTPEDRGHGRAFRLAFVRVVEAEIGPGWARRLRAAFARVGYRDTEGDA